MSFYTDFLISKWSSPMHRPKISNIRYFLFIILFTILIGCEYSSDSNNDPEPGFKYPTEIGNKWTYKHTWENFNFRPDSLTDLRPIMDFTYYVEATKDTILKDNIECIVFEQSELDFPYSSQNYYNNTKDGFYEYAYRPTGGSMALPKNYEAYNIEFAGRIFNDHADLVQFIENQIIDPRPPNDSLRYYENPRPVLQYPMIENVEWLFNNEGPFVMWKKIVGKEDVRTATGTFNCYKIFRRYEENEFIDPDSFEVYDYVSEKGLIKRTISFKNIAITSAESPEPIGYYDSSDEYILTDINF